MDLINREQALACFWNYANDDGTGYDETDMPAYERLQALPIVAEVEDCISRESVIDAIDRTDWYHINNKGELVHGANSKDDVPLYKAEDIYKAVNALPSAQPVRKTGQWIKRKKGAIGYNCSCCGKSDISNHFDYCPNCGADMRGEENE